MKTETNQTSTATHTPGPWMVRSELIRHAGQQERIRRIAITTPNNERGTCKLVTATEGPFDCMEVEQANARLIAAAPELLEALRQCADELYHWPAAQSVAKQARAAIAKAESA